ncbi:UNVERIFIED_CONTAM: hypothetical protein FKN15_005639 [Acipenser sinensis]
MNKDTEAPAVPLLSGLGQITEHLYLSSGRAANNTVLVSNSRITCIINVTQDVVNTHIPAVEYVRVPVADSPRSRLSEYFDLIADRIDEEGAKSGRALVHCNAGVSRSATLCLAYLMKYRNMTLLEAHRLVKARRPIVRPNNGFWKQLIDYENRLHRKTLSSHTNNALVRNAVLKRTGTREMSVIYLPQEDKGQAYRCQPERTKHQGEHQSQCELPVESPRNTSDFTQPGCEPALP